MMRLPLVLSLIHTSGWVRRPCSLSQRQCDVIYIGCASGEKYRIQTGNFITARKRSLGQGNVFTPVCHFCSRGKGVCPTPTPRMETPWGWADLQMQTPPPRCGWLGRPHGVRQTPLDADPPDVDPQMQSPLVFGRPPLDADPLPNMVNKWAVHILLECILVCHFMF